MLFEETSAKGQAPIIRRALSPTLLTSALTVACGLLAIGGLLPLVVGARLATRGRIISLFAGELLSDNAGGRVRIRRDGVMWASAVPGDNRVECLPVLSMTASVVTTLCLR